MTVTIVAVRSDGLAYAVHAPPPNDPHLLHLFHPSDRMQDQPTTPRRAQSPSPRGQSAKVRVRQHVNPLASSYQQPAALADRWLEEQFANTAQPFHLDIGCAKVI